MNKTIWIINEYAGSPYHGMGMRHYYLSKELLKLGWDVYIITAAYSHLLYKYPEVSKSFFLDKIDGVNYIWIKVNRYKSAHSVGRVLKWLAFSYQLNFLDIDKLKIQKPNFIIASCPELFHIMPAYRLSKKYDAKFIFEVRDIWPQSLTELNEIPERNSLIKIMKKIERFAINKSDIIISLLPLYNRYLKDNGFNKDFFYLPNGFDFNDLKIEPLPKGIEEKIPKDKFIIGYTGTIGKNDTLEYLIDAAYKLKDYKDIVFLIVGKGMEENNLKNKAKDLGLNNVIFLPPVKKTQVQSVLKLIDVCYIGWERKNIYNYGISANKIFDYMYSAKPILHSYSGEDDLIKEANCGISVDAENLDAIVNGILKLYNLSQEERSKLGENGKEFLIKYHNYEILAKKLEGVLNGSHKSIR
jgi:glycosyltransferase involved in cell wall biosynthesis